LSLSIVDEKVRVKSDTGVWYEFGLVTLSGRIHHSALVEVADPGAFDEAIVLPFGAERFKIDAITYGGRGFLRTNQVATLDPENGPVSLRVDGTGAEKILEIIEEDGRKYLNYRSSYIAGILSGILSADFTQTTYTAEFDQ
jgi:hypothetical protein